MLHSGVIYNNVTRVAHVPLGRYTYVTRVAHVTLGRYTYAAPLLQEVEALLEELRDVLPLHVREGEAQLPSPRRHLQVLRAVVDGQDRLNLQIR
eukprot:6249134-Pyramimonas_sp.AAC.1